MGKKNPVKQVIKAAGDTVAIPYREAARAVGADGIVNTIDGVRAMGEKYTNEVVDFASGSAKKKKEEAKEGERIQAGRQAEAAMDESKRLAAAETARIEGERMSAGSKSRTLLTGPAGLEDEESGITRRTLQGRRRA